MKHFILIFFLWTTVVSAQQDIYKAIEYPVKYPEKYIFDSETEYKNMIRQVPKGIGSADFTRFAETVVYGKESYFHSGKVYMNWEEMETYLNKVLQKIMPDSLKSKKNIHVYPLRKSNINAYALYDGTIFLNVGLMAELPNEASLALLLGHELAHYIHRDNLKGFIEGLKITSKDKNFEKKLELTLDKAHDDRAREKSADSLGLILASKAGYNVYYGINNFKVFKEEEDIAEAEKYPTRLVNDSTRKLELSEKEKKKNPLKGKSTKELKQLFDTHPELEDRIKFFSDFVAANAQDSKAEFLIDRTSFEKLREQSRMEKLGLLLSSGLIKQCTRKGFLYYLINNQNSTYVYYVLESIRRSCYLDHRLKEKGFLTDENHSKKFKKGQGILHDLSFLTMDSMNLSIIKSKNPLINDKTEMLFETYHEAFMYFSSLAENLKINDSYLLRALYFYNDSLQKKKYLTQYLSMTGNLKYREYAKMILKDSVIQFLEKNTDKLLLLDNVSFYDDRINGLHQKHYFGVEENIKIRKIFRQEYVNEFWNQKVKFLSDLTMDDFRGKMNFFNALSASTYIKLENVSMEHYYSDFEEDDKMRESINMFIYRPELWNFFVAHNISSIDYIDFAGFQNKNYFQAYHFSFDISNNKPYFSTFYNGKEKINTTNMKSMINHCIDKKSSFFSSYASAKEKYKRTKKVLIKFED